MAANVQAEIEAAAAAAAAGGVVVYPTETVYGIGVDATLAGTLSRLFLLKKREGNKGISLLVTGLDMASALVDGPLPVPALRLARAFWPGPLTLVLPASSAVSTILRGPCGGVGLRCSSDPLAAGLVACLGRPLTSTSANMAGKPAAGSVGEARRYFADRVSFYLDGGPRKNLGLSTVVEFFDGRAYLRRAGALGRRSLAGVVSLEE